MSSSLPTIALAGNPNVGKTSLFNRLTGADLKVGNYPGITVERVTAGVTLPSGARVSLMDVPGTYSLSARTKDEQLALQAVAGLPPHPVPDLALVVIDATQLSRNLYLLLQVLETGVGVVVALTMVDLLAERGSEIDAEALERALGVSVVIVPNRGEEGLDLLRSALERALGAPKEARSAAWRWYEQALVQTSPRIMNAAVPSRPGPSYPSTLRTSSPASLTACERSLRSGGREPRLRTDRSRKS